MRLVIDPAPFPALAGYRIGLVDETYAPDAKDLTVPDTDAQGHSTLAIALPRAPDTTHALKASITVGVNDPSGHASLATHRNPGAARPASCSASSRHSPTMRSMPAPRPRSTSPRSVRTARASPRTAQAAPGARASRLAAGDARQPRPLRDGLARRAAGDADDRHPGGRAASTSRASSTSAATASRSLEDGGMAATLRALPRRLGVVRQSGRSGPGGRLRRPQGLRARATPRASTSPRRSPAQATLLVLTDRVHPVRNLAVPAGGTDVGRAGVRRLGAGRLRHGARVPHRGGCEVAARRAPIGLAWVGIDPASASCRWRSRSPTSIRLAPAPRSGCGPHPAPGSASPRWTRASCA